MLKFKKHKITILLAVILLTISVCLAFYNNYLEERLSRQNCKMLEEIMQQQKFNFDSRLTNDMNTIKNIATNIAEIPYDKERITKFLGEVVKDTNFAYLGYALPDGELFISGGGVANISDRDYFRRAIAGKTIISNPIPARITTNKLIIVATPIYKNNAVIAVLTGSYEVNFLDELFLSSFGGTGYAYVTTNSGEIIAKSTNSYSITGTDNLFDSWATADFYMHDNLKTIHENLQANRGGHSRYSINGQKRYLHYATIGTNGWNIFSIAPEEAIAATSIQIMRASITLTLLMGLLFLGFTLYSYRAQKRHFEELFKMAYVNEVTGAPTFAKFKLDAGERIEKYKDKKSCVLLKLDVEDFKLINELYGFEVGDKVLKIMADTLGQLLSKDDAFAHMNSDEFVVLSCADKPEEHDARRLFFRKLVGEQVKELIDFKLVLPEGRCVIHKDYTNLMEVFERVNFAHRTSKKGKMPVCDYNEEMLKDAVRNKDIENKMEAALLNEEFKIFLQPKYSLSDETIAGAEALVRWKSEGIDIIYPGDFIPVFERNGFITKLDMYMFDKACAAIKDFIANGGEMLTISVNFSRHHLSNKKFVSQLCEIADKYAVPHKYLEIELTETVMYNNLDVMGGVLAELHNAGFTISMDDFGTGYSSLGLLKNIPIDVIKIDKSFFDKAENNKRATAVIGSVMDMAKRLAIKTVAEGVETIENVELLRGLGCDMVQGYYYAKPMPLPDFEKLKSNHGNYARK